MFHVSRFQSPKSGFLDPKIEGRPKAAQEKASVKSRWTFFNKRIKDIFRSWDRRTSGKNKSSDPSESIWIPNTWISDSSEYRTVKVSGIQIIVTWLGGWFESWHFGPETHFFSPVFRPPFEYRTIWQPDTNLPIEYQTSPVFKWLL